MSNPKLKKILIVGGGTAGWMSASVLVQALGRNFEIEVIESDEIATVGVGEATIPAIKGFHAMCGIDENEFLRETQGTFKLGIEFRNWGAPGEAYIHSFGDIGLGSGLVDFHHFWLKQHLAGQGGRIDDYSINVLACEHKRFRRASEAPEHRNSPLARLGHAFHFDAGLFANYLRTKCIQVGVKRTEGKIESVQTDPTSGFVTSVTLANGEAHSADLFLDCSGFRGLLIEQTLHTGYDDWSHLLPCDRAVAVPCESVRPLLPYTRSTAQRAGWIWRIPLQSRIGNGHVYCSRHVSDDEATATLLGQLDGPALAEPRLLRFVTGRRKKFWNKNVVAIGLAGGFMEPLESTSIHLIQTSIARLLNFFPNSGFDEADTAEYNRQTGLEFEQIRDFLVLHYHLNQRQDDGFWRDLREMPIPDSLGQKMALFRSNGRVCPSSNDPFGVSSWVQVMLGQGLRPAGYHSLVDTLPQAELEKMLASVRRATLDVARQMPSHEDFITKNCAAPRAMR
jgi:tryptophan halogenase